MILFPQAKINLGLNVKKKRDDGYHEIETCMYPIALYDCLEILPAEIELFKQTGIKVDSDSADNLVVRAYELVKNKFDIPTSYIHLQKNIPMGAGLGGGSADATYTIRGLNDLYELKLSSDDIAELSSELGSDCAFFAYDKPQMAKGRGEILQPIDLNLSGYYLKLVNPGIHISTSEAYSNIVLDRSHQDLKSLLQQPISSWMENIRNSFEHHIFKKHPKIEMLKRGMIEEGAVYAAMSGSGSSVFGIFKDEPANNNNGDFQTIIQL